MNDDTNKRLAFPVPALLIVLQMMQPMLHAPYRDKGTSLQSTLHLPTVATGKHRTLSSKLKKVMVKRLISVTCNKHYSVKMATTDKVELK